MFNVESSDLRADYALPEQYEYYTTEYDAVSDKNGGRIFTQKGE